jgi:cyd operon protein YbgT
MWYYTWILGVLLACSFGIINALWLETTSDLDDADATDPSDA